MVDEDATDGKAPVSQIATSTADFDAGRAEGLEEGRKTDLTTACGHKEGSPPAVPGLGVLGGLAFEVPCWRT